MQYRCSIITDKCINAPSAESADLVSRKIDTSFFTERDGKQCLNLAVVTGDIDCKYWLRDGLDADIVAAKQYANKALRSAVRAKAASWSVEADMMPDETQPHSYDFAEVSVLHAEKTSRFAYSGIAHYPRVPSVLA